MRKFLKRSLSFFLIPLTRWYLRKERKYTYKKITVTVFQGVFHPGLFHSTKFLLDYLQKQNLTGKSLLELGCGTGLLSVVCAKRGATVTASDLNPRAIENALINAAHHAVDINVLQSDVFANIPPQRFDWIILNPPYYARTPHNNEELAWHCGESFEYFQKLFHDLSNYLHATSEIIMVLTLGCELEKIFEIARKNGFQFELLEERNVLFDEKDFLYRIKSLQEKKRA